MLIDALELGSSRGDNTGLVNVSSILAILDYFQNTHVGNVYLHANRFGDVVLSVVTHFDDNLESPVNNTLQSFVSSYSGTISSIDKNRAIAIANARGNSTGAAILQGL